MPMNSWGFLPAFQTGGGGGASGSASSGSGTSQQLAMWLSGGTLGGSPNVFYNFTNNQLSAGLTPITPINSAYGAAFSGAVEARRPGGAAGLVVASTDAFLGSGASLAFYYGASVVSAVVYVAGYTRFVTTEAHSASALGTKWQVAVTNTGTATQTVRLEVGASGSVITNAALSALATTATAGFLFVPTCAGKPTGVPGAFTGNAATVYDTTNKVLWVYDTGLSNWFPVGRGVASTKTANYTITPGDSVVRADMLGGVNITFTLPAANSVPNGWSVTCFVELADIARTMTVARAGTDTINNGATSVTAVTAAGGAGYKAWELTSDGVSHWDAQPQQAGIITAI